MIRVLVVAFLIIKLTSYAIPFRFHFSDVNLLAFILFVKRWYKSVCDVIGVLNSNAIIIISAGGILGFILYRASSNTCT